MQVCSLLLHINTDPRLDLREAAVMLCSPFDGFIRVAQILPYAPPSLVTEAL